MNITLRRAVVVILLVLSAACGSSVPTSPTGARQPTVLPSPTPPPPTNVPPPAAKFPPLSGPSRTFIFERELTYRVSGYTTASRFVLYDNGAFVLQTGGGVGGYRGGYTEANGVIAFEWEGWSLAGPWGATGTVKGNSLTVQYNLIMQLTDFEDAVYVLMP